MARLLLGALFIAVLTTAAPAVPYADCGSTYNLMAVDIEGCKGLPCRVYAGQAFNVTSTFYANSASNSVMNDVYFVINAVELRATVTGCTCADTDGRCTDHDHDCYIAEGETLEYNAQVLADESLPPVAGELVWEMFNESQNKIICYRVDVLVIWDR